MPACRFGDVTLAGFEPGTEVTVTCHGEQQGGFSASPVTIGADGTATDNACDFGYAGERFWVDADGVTSPTFVWPPG